MKLINGEKGSVYKIEKINLNKNVKRRLESIGMTENSTISILNKKRKALLLSE